jgi:nucleotide-binding universal stress UspA family protein
MRVLAALDDSARASPVSEFAVALGRVLGATVDALHVRSDGFSLARAAAASVGIALRVEDGEPRVRLRIEAEAGDVVATVLGRSREPTAGPVGAIARELLTTLPRPVGVVPVDSPHPARLRRVLVPLEGTVSTSLAPRQTIGLARGAGLEIVIVHVLDLASVPMFTDQPHHEMAAWTAEFLARYCPCPPEDVRLETRIGEPSQQIVQVAHDIDADVIALGWAQELATGRAPIVSVALEANVPVFLIPVRVP